MKQPAGRYPWRSFLGLYALVLAAWFLSRLTAPPSGSMEDLHVRVRVGTSKEEAVEALQSGERDHVECIYVSGTTRDGRRFMTFFSLTEGMPPASEIHDAELAVTCSDGSSVEVTLGEGGVVTAKRYVPDPDRPETYLFHWLHLVFGHTSRHRLQLTTIPALVRHPRRSIKSAFVSFGH